MALCPECDSDLELDAYDVNEGEDFNCPECSQELRLVSKEPVAVETAD